MPTDRERGERFPAVDRWGIRTTDGDFSREYAEAHARYRRLKNLLGFATVGFIGAGLGLGMLVSKSEVVHWLGAGAGLLASLAIHVRLRLRRKCPACSRRIPCFVDVPPVCRCGARLRAA